MSAQKISGVVILLIGVTTLTISAGAAWILSRISRMRQVEGVGFITMVSFMLFLVGMLLGCFVVSAIVDVGA
jgi:hypothetical protein